MHLHSGSVMLVSNVTALMLVLPVWWLFMKQELTLSGKTSAVTPSCGSTGYQAEGWFKCGWIQRRLNFWVNMTVWHRYVLSCYSISHRMQMLKTTSPWVQDLCLWVMSTLLCQQENAMPCVSLLLTWKLSFSPLFMLIISV